MKLQLLSAILIAALLSGCGHRHRDSAHARQDLYSPAFVDTKRNAFVVHNLPYTEKKTSIEQTLDLYMPALSKPPFKLLIWVHGGSWMHGDKKSDCLACDYLLGKYAVASVNYRLDDKASFPAQIHDLKAAVRFLRSKATKYGLDPNAFGVWGTSAGGHLAALLGTSGGVKELEGDEGWSKYSSRVQAVCDWCGPSDFNTAEAQRTPNSKISFTGRSSPVSVLMGGKMDERSLAQASPVTYISKDCPPFLIMHGLNDDAIPPLQSAELHNMLKNQNCDSTLLMLKETGHAIGTPEHVKMAEKFFDEKLNSAKAK